MKRKILFLLFFKHIAIDLIVHSFEVFKYLGNHTQSCLNIFCFNVCKNMFVTFFINGVNFFENIRGFFCEKKSPNAFIVFIHFTSNKPIIFEGFYFFCHIWFTSIRVTEKFTWGVYATGNHIKNPICFYGEPKLRKYKISSIVPE